jgi:hypothetical protein
MDFDEPTEDSRPAHLRPPMKSHVCNDCLFEFYENEPLRRRDLGRCIECGLKEIGSSFEPAVLRRKDEV